MSAPALEQHTGPAGLPATTASPGRPVGAVVRSPAGPAATTTGLTKRFRGGQVAVDGIDLQVPRGAVYGFLGPNGSGKTTTIRMLLGLVTPTAGGITLLGRPMPDAGREVLAGVGALVEGPAFHPYLSGRDNLRRLDAVDQCADPRTSAARIDGALSRVGLGAAAGKGFRQYSLGMKQRLGLAGALLQPRELLVLDEPTNGLDPQGTREVRTLVRALADEGTTVIVSSHLLAEIEQVCSHVGIMSRGRMVLQGPLADLAGAGGARVQIETRDPDRALAVLAGSGLVATASHHAERDSAAAVVSVPLDGGDTSGRGPARGVEDLAATLVHAGVPISGLRVQRPSLEDVFVELTGEGFDVAR